MLPDDFVVADDVLLITESVSLFVVAFESPVIPSWFIRLNNAVLWLYWLTDIVVFAKEYIKCFKT